MLGGTATCHVEGAAVRRVPRKGPESAHSSPGQAQMGPGTPLSRILGGSWAQDVVLRVRSRTEPQARPWNRTVRDR